jgi:hypothetical protein
MGHYHQRFQVIISFCIILLLSSCQGVKLENQIVGTWTDIEGNDLQLTINGDGTAGTDEIILKWTINENGEILFREDNNAEEIKIKFLKDLMSPNGRLIVYGPDKEYEITLFKNDGKIESKDKEGYRAGIKYDGEKYPQNTDVLLFKSIQAAINADDLHYLFAHLIITLDDAWDYINPETRSFQSLTAEDWRRLCAVNYDTFKENPDRLNRLNRGIEFILDKKFKTDQGGFATTYTAIFKEEYSIRSHRDVITDGVEFGIVNIDGKWYVLEYDD